MRIQFTLNGDPVEVKLKSGDRLLSDVCGPAPYERKMTIAWAARILIRARQCV